MRDICRARVRRALRLVSAVTQHTKFGYDLSAVLRFMTDCLLMLLTGFKTTMNKPKLRKRCPRYRKSYLLRSLTVSWRSTFAKCTPTVWVHAVSIINSTHQRLKRIFSPFLVSSVAPFFPRISRLSTNASFSNIALHGGKFMVQKIQI